MNGYRKKRGKVNDMTKIEQLILANQISIMKALYDNIIPTVYKNTSNVLWISINKSKEVLESNSDE